MSTPIQVVVETITNGSNHISIFYNPLKGKHNCIKVFTGGQNNGPSMAMRILHDWEKILVINYDVKAKHFKNAMNDDKLWHESNDDTKKVLEHFITQP